MMRQKLALVVKGSPSLTLRRMNGFSPVKMTRFGSAGIAAAPCKMPDGLPTPCRSRKDDRMTKVILFRHGHVEGISPERFRGRADLALTPQGLRQAEATMRRIEASWTPAALYASPLSRCRATAEAIGGPCGLTP